METENHWFAKTGVTPVVGKNHPWILKINGHKYDEKKPVIWAVSNYLSTGYLLTLVRNSTFMDTTLTRLKLSIPRGIILGYPGPSDELHWEGNHPFCGVSAQHA